MFSGAGPPGLPPLALPLLKKHAPMIAEVEAAIRERGPLGNADFREAGQEGPGRLVELAAGDARARLPVHERAHARPLARPFSQALRSDRARAPAAPGAEPLSAEAFRRWHLDHSLPAMGAATETDLRMYLTFPGRGPAQRAGDAARARCAAASGRDGADRRARQVVRAARGPRRARGRATPSPPSRRRRCSAPFDSFLWHRERTRRLFGFDYRIEVYVPGRSARTATTLCRSWSTAG